MDSVGAVNAQLVLTTENLQRLKPADVTKLQEQLAWLLRRQREGCSFLVIPVRDRAKALSLAATLYPALVENYPRWRVTALGAKFVRPVLEALPDDI